MVENLHRIIQLWVINAFDHVLSQRIVFFDFDVSIEPYIQCALMHTLPKGFSIRVRQLILIIETYLVQQYFMLAIAPNQIIESWRFCESFIFLKRDFVFIQIKRLIRVRVIALNENNKLFLKT